MRTPFAPTATFCPKDPAMFRTPVGTFLLMLGCFCLSATAAELAEPIERAEPNRWVKLPVKRQIRGYEYAQPVYVPDRQQLLHWGVVRNIYRVPKGNRNDVLAFDAAAGDWTSDYPSTPDLAAIVTIHNSGRGAYYKGRAAMLDGIPTPSAVMFGGCWDSQRKQLVYTMPGLMAAYDPATKEWHDLDAKTVLNGKTFPGGPPLYAVGTAYDPVNDEIVLFPHFSGQGDPKNLDRLEATGQVSSHLGTLRFSYRDRTWRRVSDTFGTPKVQAARKQVLGWMGTLSDALDAVYVLRHQNNDQQSAAVLAAAKQLAGETAQAQLPPQAKQPMSRVQPPLQTFQQQAAAQNWQAAMEAGAEALRHLERVREEDLRVEPPGRCAAPLAYHPGQQALVLFGGHSGLVRSDIEPSVHLGGQPSGLNDTWLYDLKTRQWRELATPQRPPETRIPHLFYDPASEQMLLVTFQRSDERAKRPPISTVWTLDLEKEAWHKRAELPLPAEPAVESTYASRTSVANVGFDPHQRLLVWFQNHRQDKTITQQTCVMRVNLDALPRELAPQWQPDPPIVPQTLPEENPEWIDRLKQLPANTWVATEPEPREASRRDWGNIALDPLHGHIYYFGGGHSTYQVNDVSIYAVGANRWVFAAGDHDDFIPPVGWGGLTMGFRGGTHASHQRNEYQAVDRRMYTSIGGDAYNDKRAGTTWFYDVDRGGVWRMKPVAKLELEGDLEQPLGQPHMSDTQGRIHSLNLVPEHRYSRRVKEFSYTVYDAYANRLTVKKIPQPWPMRMGESRRFCLLPDRKQIFYYEWKKGNNEGPEAHSTWLYDIQANRFVDQKPKRLPPAGRIHVATYLQGHEAVLAVIRNEQSKESEPWVYSLEHHNWAPLPTAGEKIRYVGPYGQLVYVAKFGVVVSVRKPNAVLRPDLRQIDWN